MAGRSNFSAWPFRFQFRAVDTVFFPHGKAGNVLRGAFGSIFRRLACVPHCSQATSCEIAGQCAYALTFEPRQQWAETSGPSGLADWPRPFVFRALHLDGKRIPPGAEFYFDVVLFESPEKVLPYFVLAFRALAEAGIGPAHGRANLSSVEELPIRTVVYDGKRLQNRALPGLAFNLTKSPGESVSALRVKFLTPTELKAGGELIDAPEFPAVLRRLRDRISNLRSLYQGGPLELDFAALGKAADEVRISRSSLRRVELERFSSRTRQSHPLGGFVGEVEYEGNLSPFLPYLRAGEWTGVGRQTVWGKGSFSIAQADDYPNDINNL
jgi:hypothetical protein